MDCLAAANTAFAFNLYKALSKENNTDNLFFSPLSISSALAMVSMGAKGNTAAQMSKVLVMTGDEKMHSESAKVISEINKPGTKYLLSLANRLFGESSYDFLAPFTDSCQKFYHADLEKLNFVTKAEDSRKHINGWVEEKTAGKIQNLLAPGIVNGLTKLVLVNAIYFKGDWANQFLKDRTMEKPFRINKLEREITYEKLMDWIKPEMMDLTEVELSLPKFKLEETYDLKPVLRSMGMTEAFDQGKADFSGMSSNNDLVLSEVVHKSFVEVNEEGTEAAAATAVIMMMRCAMIVPRFTADHPFLFFIWHNKTRSILFYGRFCSP
ncbi:serpin B6-like isoform X2 [Hemicordylus capensis]|uniref:serpin B6-like isoform X2 n=1 Tax=Hemicordylus capensis TaxID=884348 RepID=UPI002303FB7E|nr:serpin B6-like isoform X2 [Hemicordylus capensis]